MTIRTKEFNVLQRIVGPVTIFVVKFKRNGKTQPFSFTAMFTLVFL